MRRGWIAASVLAVGLGLAIFALYFLAYPIRHVSLPAGFDPPFYVWRAQHLAAAGLGSGTLASRPGYPILSTLLGSVTGLSQIDMTIFLSMALVPVLALSVGAFVVNGIDRSRLAWVITVAAAGVVVGATHLVGENLANILDIAIEIAALVPLTAAVTGEAPTRGLCAAVALMVASGMSHWIFMPLFLAVLSLACLLALRSSLDAWRGGLPLWRTESGILVTAGAASSGIIALLIGAVLRAPFRTIEIAQLEDLFRKKIRTDAARLAVPGSLGLLGIRWIPSIRRRARADAHDRRFTFSMRVLTSWTWVMGIGLAFGLLTYIVPPTRFLAHLVALSGAVAVAILLIEAARWLRHRVGRGSAASRAVPAAVVVVVLAVLALPGLIRWYPYPVLLDPETLAEARSAARYVSALPPGQPVVFLTDYRGGAPAAYTTVLIDRTIKIAMSPPRDLDVFIFPGTLEDLLAGRRTPPPFPNAELATRSYWEADQRILPLEPPILVLRTSGPSQFDDALARGAALIAPGVAKFRGPEVALGPATASPGPSPAASVGSGLGWGLVVLLLLWVVGSGWTRVVVGVRVPPEVFLSMAPAVGAAALILGGLVAAKAGVRPAGLGGVLTVVGVAGVGWAGALLTRR
jgi:hypothetical protein